MAVPMSEAQYQQRVTDFCDVLGLRWHHETDSRRSKEGFPDLVIVGPNGVAFIELKSDRGRVTQAQRDWLEDLRPHVWVGVWKPADWPEAERFLRRLAGRA